jgi:hypothetical protein
MQSLMVKMCNFVNAKAEGVPFELNVIPPNLSELKLRKAPPAGFRSLLRKLSFIFNEKFFLGRATHRREPAVFRENFPQQL